MLPCRVLHGRLPPPRRRGLELGARPSSAQLLPRLVAVRGAHLGRIDDEKRTRSSSLAAPRSRIFTRDTATGPMPVWIIRSGPCPCRTRRSRPSGSLRSCIRAKNASASSSTACARSRRAPERRIRQGIFELFRLTEADNIGRRVHGVSLSSRSSGGLTPASIRRLHIAVVQPPRSAHQLPALILMVLASACSALGTVSRSTALLSSRDFLLRLSGCSAWTRWPVVLCAFLAIEGLMRSDHPAFDRRRKLRAAERRDARSIRSWPEKTGRELFCSDSTRTKAKSSSA